MDKMRYRASSKANSATREAMDSIQGCLKITERTASDLVAKGELAFPVIQSDFAFLSLAIFKVSIGSVEVP